MNFYEVAVTYVSLVIYFFFINFSYISMIFNNFISNI